MIKYNSICVWLEEDSFPLVRDVLDKYGCVDPKINSNGLREDAADETRVYEHKGVGIWRAQFHQADASLSRGPYVLFRYWGNRVNQEIVDSDPMCSVVLEVAKLLNERSKASKVTDIMNQQISLEEMVSK